MKITKITRDEENIIVTLEEYPHAQPVFPADISAKELEVALREWKINQDECDDINKARQDEVVKEEPVLSAELKAMEGTEITDKVVLTEIPEE